LQRDTALVVDKAMKHSAKRMITAEFSSMIVDATKNQVCRYLMYYIDSQKKNLLQKMQSLTRSHHAP
jgi:hypothetical protein